MILYNFMLYELKIFQTKLIISGMKCPKLRMKEFMFLFIGVDFGFLKYSAKSCQ